MSTIHDRFVERLNAEEKARYTIAVATGICWEPGCMEPVFALFKCSPAYKCAKHGVEALAGGIEAVWEGDTPEEIAEGKRVAAIIRSRCGIPGKP